MSGDNKHTNNVVAFRPKPRISPQGMIKLGGKKPITHAHDKIPALQFTSLYILIEFVADQLHVSEAMVQAIITTAFYIDHIEQLTVQDYEQAIRFLVQLRCKVLAKSSEKSSH